MILTYNKLANIVNPIFRNINAIALDFDEFDDLSPDTAARSYAQKLTKQNIKYNAIDYIFDRTDWNSSRYGNSTYPVWYGALELKTTFQETFFHYLQKFILAPNGFSGIEEKLIPTQRTVFTVKCGSSLIDLRDLCDQNPTLLDSQDYNFTQSVGAELYEQGYPGLITKSVRNPGGNNLAIFNKDVLTSPYLFSYYRYEYDHGDRWFAVYDTRTNEICHTSNS